LKIDRGGTTINRTYKYIIICIMMIFIFVSCTRISNDNLLEDNGFGVEKKEFVNCYKLTKDYSQGEIFNSKQLKKFLEEHYLNNLLLLAAACSNHLDQEKEFLRDFEKIKNNNLQLYA